MAQKDLFSDVEVRNAFDFQEITTDTTTDGDAIDLQGFESCTILFQSGTITDGDYTPLLEESDTGAFGGEESAVADADLIGTEAGAAFTDNTDDNQVSKLGYKGHKRYVRPTIVSTSTSSGGFIGAIALLGHPRNAPKTDQNADD